MEQQATAETSRFKYGSRDFPILYEDHHVRVYKNPSSEIFVENKGNEKSTIRVSTDRDGFSVTAHNGVLTPWAVNGLPAFLVRGR